MAQEGRKAQPDPNQSDRDKKNWFLINSIHESQSSALQSIHLSWKLHIAGLVGFQRATISGVIHKHLTIDPPKPGDVRSTDNQLWPIHKTTLAKLLQVVPEFGVRPASGEDADIQAADLSKRLLKHLHDNVLELRKRLRECYPWMLSCGTGFLNHWWNPDLGRQRDAWRIDGQIQSDEKMREQYGEFEYGAGHVYGPAWEQPQPIEGLGWERTALAEGEQELSVESPFSVYPDPMATNLSNAQFVLIVKAMSLNELYEQFGNQAKYVRPEGQDLYASSIEKEMMDLFLSSQNVIGDQVRKVESTKSEYALVKQLQTRPNLRKGEKVGRIITMAGGRILSDKPNPYKHKDFTLFMFRENIMPGQFWGRATLEQNMPQQRTRNNLLSQMLENFRKFGHYDWLIPINSKMKRPSNRPGVHRYNVVGGREPKVISPPAFPTLGFNLLQLNADAMINTSGIHEVTLQAKPPGGVTSGTAIRSLQRQDEMRMSGTTEEINDELIRMAKYELMNAQQFYTETRIMRAFSEGRATKVQSFKGEDLKNSFDVIIEQRDIFPRDPVERAQMILQFYQLGVYGIQGDPKVLRHVREQLHLGPQAVGFSVEQQSEDEAVGENTMLERGEMPEVNSWQDHGIHIEVHRSLILSGKFKQFPPELKQMISAHADEHGRWLEMMFTPTPEEEMQAAMQQQAEAEMQQPKVRGPVQKPKPAGGGGNAVSQ